MTEISVNGLVFIIALAVIIPAALKKVQDTTTLPSKKRACTAKFDCPKCGSTLEIKQVLVVKDRLIRHI